MITDFSFYQCVPDEHASITARHPNHTAAYTGIGIEISVKQYSTATAARIMIPAIAAIPLKTDFLIYIKTHLSLTGFPFDRSILTDQVCHKTDSCSLVFYFS